MKAARSSLRSVRAGALFAALVVLVAAAAAAPADFGADSRPGIASLQVGDAAVDSAAGPASGKSPAADGTPASSPPAASASGRAGVEPVTLSVREMEIHELLAMLSRSRNLNVVCAEDVSGRLSLNLHEVPFDQALDAAAAMVGCEAVLLDNIYFVSRIRGEDAQGASLRQAETFRLDYAKPADVEAVVKEMLSARGRATSYPPLRTVVVEDRPDVLRRIRTVVGDLDRPPRQVLIEARIMEARLAKDLRFGIDWSVLFSPGDGEGKISVEGFTTPREVRGEGLFMSWGEGDFQAALESIEGVDELNTLAAPRILATDGMEAEIIIGDELGFSVVSTLENAIIQSVEFLDTGTQLRITPTIASDGYILMHVHPELSNGVVQEGLPSKTTAEVTTDVLIKDGHTLFIGGLIRERDESIRRGIPLLVRIPVLGALFGKISHSTEKTELITLITPKIVHPGEPVEY